MHQEPNYHVRQNKESEQRKDESDQAGYLQRHRAEACHHVHRVRYQLAKGVSGSSLFPGSVIHGYGREAIGAPCQQYIDRDKRPFVVREGFSYLGAKGAEGTNLPRNLGAHHILQGQLGHP